MKLSRAVAHLPNLCATFGLIAKPGLGKIIQFITPPFTIFLTLFFEAVETE